MINALNDYDYNSWIGHTLRVIRTTLLMLSQLASDSCD